MSVPLVIDANSLIIRGIKASAMDDLKAGEIFTGGIYATLNTLRSILMLPGLNVGRMYAFFDNGVPKFREKLFGAFYKEKRKKRKETLTPEQREKAYTQLHKSRKMLELLGVNCLAYKNREADDSVAAAVFELPMSSAPVVVSGDKDLWQLVNWGARVWYIGQSKSRWVDEDNFKERTAESFKCEGVYPWEYLLFKAMVGDSSDCIPGAYGVGPKRAIKLIEDWVSRDSCVNTHDAEFQLQRLVESLAELPKRKKYEDAFLESVDWLKQVLKGIDLRGSFGSTRHLKKALDRPTEFQELKFLKFCKKLQFNSVMGDPERFTRPFREAAKRREKE